MFLTWLSLQIKHKGKSKGTFFLNWGGGPEGSKPRRREAAP